MGGTRYRLILRRPTYGCRLPIMLPVVETKSMIVLRRLSRLKDRFWGRRVMVDGQSRGRLCR